MEDGNRIIRVLHIYNKFQNGGIINKTYEANKYGVSERTIQRDIEDIREYLEGEVTGNGVLNSVIYDRTAKGYHLDRIYEPRLKGSEILAICKILLDSRAFVKKEMDNVIGSLIDCCAVENEREVIKDLVANEQYHYIELRHQSEFLDVLWDIGQAIRKRRFIEIDYIRIKDGKTVKRLLRPAAIMFSEFYFYMAAFIDDEEVKEDFEVLGDVYPTIYRIDRIHSVSLLDETFNVPYKDRFEEGEFRKRIQFMYGGRLQRIKFKYSGYSVEAVLDRLPTAKILAEEDGVYTITAEVFGKGIEMWLESQGNVVEILSN